MEYFCSDLHIGHKNVLKFDWHKSFEPFGGYASETGQRDEWIVNKIKSLTDRDTLYIMGDLIFTSVDWTKEYLKKNLEACKAKKVWILGNHDSKEERKYFSDCFDEICYYKEYKHNKKKYILCHYPIQDWNGKYKGSVHIHGHQHSPTTWGYNRMENRYDISFTGGKLLWSIDEIEAGMLDKNIFKSLNYDDDIGPRISS